MKKTGSLVLIYGVVVLVGGLIGHYKSQSMASLISGITFGTLLILSGLALIKKKHWAQWIALSLAFLLDAFFSWRFAQTLKFFPSGLMSVISLAMVAIIALRMHMYYKKR
jgi:hypothetical protein